MKSINHKGRKGLTQSAQRTKFKGFNFVPFVPS
jgi:hypothetical protein